MRTLFYRLPRLSILAILVILAGAAGALLSLGRQEDPTLVERFGYILTTLPGADAERIEALSSGADAVSRGRAEAFGDLITELAILRDAATRSTTVGAA